MTKRTVPLIFRQGDVMIRAVQAIPATAKAEPLRDDGRVTLALGEATGHHHSFFDRRVCMFRDDGLGRTFVRVEAGESGEDAMLKHQEHTAIPVPPGYYELVNQLQYTPEAIRRVED